MKLWIMTLFVLALSLPAYAQGGLSLGKPGYGGPGCPGGTASVALSRDGTSLSLRFLRYQVAAGGARSFDRKACSLAIPVHVAGGKSVSILSVAYRGFNRLPASATSEFRIESFFSGGQGPVFTRKFSGPQQGSFAIAEAAAVKASVWSSCGADVTLRTNSSLLVRSANGRIASASVTSQDVQSAIVYTLQWRNC
jgi:hypothetical protein